MGAIANTDARQAMQAWVVLIAVLLDTSRKVATTI
jgi:hypothetical protein